MNEQGSKEARKQGTTSAARRWWSVCWSWVTAAQIRKRREREREGDRERERERQRVGKRWVLFRDIAGHGAGVGSRCWVRARCSECGQGAGGWRCLFGQAKETFRSNLQCIWGLCWVFHKAWTDGIMVSFHMSLCSPKAARAKIQGRSSSTLSLQMVG